jgi:hypothetical protein
MLRKIGLAAALLLLSCAAGSAQTTVRPCVTLGVNNCQPISASNPLPVSASISGFAPAGAYGMLTATGSSATTALPAGAVVVAYNTGTTAVSCTLGVTAVANEDQIAPGGFFSYTVGNNANIACIDQTGSVSNLVVLSGGSGVATGSGGGGSGGGAVTVADGADVAQGSTTQAACAGDATSGCSIEQRLQRIAQDVTTLNGTAAAALADCGATPCTNKIGVVGVNTWGGSTLGAGSNYGTSPGAVVVPGVNASMMQGTTAMVSEPCQTAAKSYVPINGIATATTTRIVLNSGSKVIYVCHVFLNTSIAEAISFVDGTTGAACGAGIDALIGDTTADATHGVQLAANEGFSIGTGGYAITATASNKDLCIVTSSTGIVRGSIAVVQQ